MASGRDDSGVSKSELRAVEHNVFGGRRVLWAGVAAVVLPLLILLGLQYWWLTELERNSALAREALETCVQLFPHYEAYYRLSQLCRLTGDEDAADRYLALHHRGRAQAGR